MCKEDSGGLMRRLIGGLVLAVLFVALITQVTKVTGFAVALAGFGFAAAFTALMYIGLSLVFD